MSSQVFVSSLFMIQQKQTIRPNGSFIFCLVHICRLIISIWQIIILNKISQVRTIHKVYFLCPTYISVPILKTNIYLHICFNLKSGHSGPITFQTNLIRYDFVHEPHTLLKFSGMEKIMLNGSELAKMKK